MTSLSPPVGGRVVLVTEAQVPLADGVGGEARVLEELRHDLDVGCQTAGHQRLDVHVLPPHPVLDTRAVSPRRLIDITLKFLNFYIDIQFMESHNYGFPLEYKRGLQ